MDRQDTRSAQTRSNDMIYTFGAGTVQDRCWAKRHNPQGSCSPCTLASSVLGMPGLFVAKAGWDPRGSR